MFEFSLRFGEHYYENSGFLSDLVIALLGSFVGFYLALWASKKQEMKSNLDILLHFSGMIDNITDSTKRQLKHFENLSIEIKDKPLKIHLVGLIATQDFERIKLVDSNSLYKSFNYYYKNRLSDFKSTFSRLDLIALFVKDLVAQNEKHINFTFKDQLYVRDGLENLTHSIGLYLKRIQEHEPLHYSSNQDYMYLLPYMQLLIDLSKGGVNDLSLYEQNVLIPLHDSILYDLKDKIIGEQLFYIIKMTRNRLDSIKFNSIAFANSLSGAKTSIEKAIEKLDIMSTQIKKLDAHK